MIRVELIYGRRSFPGNLLAAFSTMWLSVAFAIIAALVALYFIPFADLWSSVGREGLAADQAAERASEQGMLSPVVSAQERRSVQKAERVVVLPPVESTAAREGGGSPLPATEQPLPRETQSAQQRETQSAQQGESALVLPPIGSVEESVAAAAPALTASVGAGTYTTACQAAIKIKSQIPADVEWGLLSCRGSGEYELSGTVANSLVLDQLEKALQDLLVDESVTSSREVGGGLYFFLVGRLADMRGGELATLSPEQAQRLFAKVEHWADQCGIDGIAFSKPTSTPLNSAQARQRRRLVGTGSHGQIGAFLGKLRSAEETAALAELILNPVQIDGDSRAESRLSVAIDVVVGAQ